MAAFDPSLNSTTTNVLGYSQYDPYPRYQVDGATQFFDTANPILSKGVGWFILFGMPEQLNASPFGSDP